MKYKIGDKILQISNGIFIRLGVIISIREYKYEIKWLEKGDHVNNLSPIRTYPNSFIENSELFDLVNTENIEYILNKYVNLEDYETCIWIKNNLN